MCDFVMATLVEEALHAGRPAAGAGNSREGRDGSRTSAERSADDAAAADSACRASPLRP